MRYEIQLPKRSLPTALLLGAMVGAVFLGVGGRIAMRIFAVLDGLPPGFSIGGTLPVILMGAEWGVLGGGLLWLGRRTFPASPMARGALFWIPLTLIFLRGLNPLSVDRLLAFTPFYLMYGAALYRVWCHRIVARGAVSAPAIA